MKYASFPLLAIAVVVVACGIGCSSSDSSSTSSALGSPESQGGTQGEHAQLEEHGHEAGHEHHADASSEGHSDMEKMTAELAKLTPEDRESAEKQHFCPVSGEMLGTMGPPVKMDVSDQEVWICCNGCKDKLLANPDEYLAKLKKD